jgi:hypothetical protein
VTDSGGLSNAGSFKVFVVANKPPKLVGIERHTVTATGPQGAVVTFNVRGADNEDGPLPAVCAPASNSMFPIGETLVTCAVTDSAGATSTGTFRVNVLLQD